MKKNQNIIQNKINILPIQLLILIAPFLVGLFYEFSSVVVSAYLIGCLWFYSTKNKSLKFVLNDSTVAVFAIVFFYALSTLWAVDKGMAIFGFVKFSPILPFSLIVIQLTGEDKKKIFSMIPVSGVIMTVLSYGLSFIEPLKGFLLVESRLSGFFQYPNVFALFLLIGIVIIATGEKLSWKSLVYITVLLFGIFASGSRIVFGLMLIMAVIILLSNKNKKMKIAFAAIMATAIVISLCYVLITKNYTTIGRYLTSSSNYSSFLLRILYIKDVLPVIKDNPFGLGYLGYYYAHHSFQTGVYDVMYIHNEFFQIILDIGILPAALFVFALIKSFIYKKNSLQNRLIMLTILAHCFFDFDLQYISIFLILILTLDFDSEKSYNIIKFKRPMQISSVLVLFVCLFFGTSNCLYYFGANATALKIYPNNTQAQIKLLRGETDSTKANILADNILKNNSDVPLAYSTKAAVAYSNGDFAKMIEYQETAISKAKYDINLYVDYIEMLKKGVELYNASGDEQSAGYCIKKLKEIPGMLNKEIETSDNLAWQVYDKSKFKLPEQYLTYLASLSA